MRLAIYSDLHVEHLRPGTEYQIPTTADIVVLAGDIHRTTHGLEWARKMWPDLPIVYVPGNHEFYGAHLFGTLMEMRRKAETLDIHLLSNNVLIMDDIRILGTPLWTDFALYGTSAESERVACRTINDFRVIREHCGPLTTSTMAQLHREAKLFLRQELDKQWAGKTVVVTHWLPHPLCIAAQFQGSDLSPYFCTDCSDLLDSYSIDLWVFGHSHNSMDITHPSGCRLISNQRGYPHESPKATGVRKDFIVDITDSLATTL